MAEPGGSWRAPGSCLPRQLHAAAQCPGHLCQPPAPLPGASFLASAPGRQGPRCGASNESRRFTSQQHPWSGASHPPTTAARAPWAAGADRAPAQPAPAPAQVHGGGRGIFSAVAGRAGPGSQVGGQEAVASPAAGTTPSAHALAGHKLRRRRLLAPRGHTDQKAPLGGPGGANRGVGSPPCGCEGLQGEAELTSARPEELEEAK